MIQRIQTVYLFLVVVFTLMFLFFPIGMLETDAGKLGFKSWQMLGEGHGYLGIISSLLAFLIMLLSIYTIFNFKKYLYQIKLGKINILLNIFMIVSAFFFVDGVKESTQAEFTYGIGILFPLLSLIMILMANKAIRKDYNLVKSPDRLR